MPTAKDTAPGRPPGTPPGSPRELYIFIGALVALGIGLAIFIGAHTPAPSVPAGVWAFKQYTFACTRKGPLVRAGRFVEQGDRRAAARLMDLYQLSGTCGPVNTGTHVFIGQACGILCQADGGYAGFHFPGHVTRWWAPSAAMQPARHAPASIWQESPGS
jgi:hypothetical protein